jgi:hypothetical protein
MIKFFKKKEQQKHLINAMLDAEKAWPNNMDYGKIMRSFAFAVRKKQTLDEEELYDMLMDIAKNSQPCKL